MFQDGRPVPHTPLLQARERIMITEVRVRVGVARVGLCLGSGLEKLGWSYG